ncbi:MAG: glycerate kinase [Saprospiraceae bacterium]|nr:glycerate kinase [Saprospiraceae bacterium]
MEATYLISDNVAYIELAKTSGLAWIEKDKRDILKANTYGTGILITRCHFRKSKRGDFVCRGSATVDGGTGIMQALGIYLFDKNNQAIPKNVNALPLVASFKIDKTIAPKRAKI